MTERDSMSFDVVIVGAGPAGLAAAIRLKQLATSAGREVTVVVLEKGASLGAHILSGAIVDPVGLDRLLPDWRGRGAPLTQPVVNEHLGLLTAVRRLDLPHRLLPPAMRHAGCYVGSLGTLVQWLGAEAEALGVEVYPGFGAAETVHDERGAVTGVLTPDQGVGRDGQPTEAFVAGIELRGRYTLIAEGARGFLAGKLIRRFDLAAGRQPGKYAIGIKELWQVAPERHRPGRVEHLVGWPLPRGVAGGGFLYHYGDNLVAVGHVTHADYAGPDLSPFDTMQRLKTHPALRGLFAGATRIGYGARTIADGGWQSAPRLVFPGGALVGCAGGLLDPVRMKGVHHAILSGMLAAEDCFAALQAGRAHDALAGYEARLREGEIGRALQAGRNFKPLLERFGPLAGGALAAAEQWSRALTGLTLPVTLGHEGRDRDALRPRPGVAGAPLQPDGVLTFDRQSSLLLAGVEHPKGQPRHLKLADPARSLANVERFGQEPAECYCPAEVYEVRPRAAGGHFLHISAGNCLHCKLCDIKDPAGNISWTLPAAGGPRYVGL